MESANPVMSLSETPVLSKSNSISGRRVSARLLLPPPLIASRVDSQRKSVFSDSNNPFSTKATLAAPLAVSIPITLIPQPVFQKTWQYHCKTHRSSRASKEKFPLVAPPLDVYPQPDYQLRLQPEKPPDVRRQVLGTVDSSTLSELCLESPKTRANYLAPPSTVDLPSAQSKSAPRDCAAKPHR